MVIPIDAVDLEDFKRMDRGLPPRPKPKINIPEPDPPIVEDRMKFEDIPNQEIRDFNARRRSVKNKDGVIFTGYVFYLEFQSGKKLQGWLPENEFLKLKARIPESRTDLLNKIG